MAKKRPAQAIPPGAKLKRAEDAPPGQAPTEQVSREPASIEPIEASKIPTPIEAAPDTNEVAARSGFRLTLPLWPNSKRGPQATPPPPGMHSINLLRPEQLAEVGYNQETGKPGIESPARSLPDKNQGTLSFDQSETAQDAMRKHKKERL